MHAYSRVETQLCGQVTPIVSCGGSSWTASHPSEVTGGSVHALPSGAGKQTCFSPCHWPGRNAFLEAAHSPSLYTGEPAGSMEGRPAAWHQAGKGLHSWRAAFLVITKHHLSLFWETFFWEPLSFLFWLFFSFFESLLGRGNPASACSAASHAYKSLFVVTIDGTN